MNPQQFFTGKAIGTIVVLVMVGGFFVLNNYIYTQKQGSVVVKGYKDSTYIVEGKPVTLVDGLSEVDVAANSAAKITTRIFGNEAEGDLNNDGLPDTAFVLTESSGGSGTFYYAVVALKTAAGGYVGTNAILLGDRVAPQTTEIRDGEVIVNYADRKPGEPMTVQPSLGVSKYLKISNNQLIVVQK